MARFHKKNGKRSGFESKVCADLDRRKIPYQYEPDRLKYWRVVKGARCDACQSITVTKPATYTPDLKFGNGTYCEIKGRFTSENRTRMREFKTACPMTTVRLLFQMDNWTTSKKLQRYSDWCKKYGYEYSVGHSVPRAWVK